jgi:hypothetical protein
VTRALIDAGDGRVALAMLCADVGNTPAANPVQARSAKSTGANRGAAILL